MKARFEQLVNRKVVQFRRVIKSLFYFLEFDKDEVCMEHTQMFFWKKARHLWNDKLITKMADFQFQVKKDHPIKTYQTINFIEKSLEGITQDEINAYNFSLGIVYRWILLAIEARKKDIISRLAQSKQMREVRLQKIEERNQQAEEYKNSLAQEQEKYEIDNKAEIERYQEYKAAVDSGNPPDLDEGEMEPTLPTFDKDFFDHQWKEDHPEIEIPPEVVEDVDNDWVIPPEKKEEMVQDYQNQISEALATIEAAKAAAEKQAGKK